MRPLRIGTRGSALALWQARAVATALERAGTPAELVTITTRGDARQDAPLSALGGKGVFVTEIHEAMLRGEIDLAVHSAKDMAAVPPEGLVIAAVLPREDPRDALVLPAGHTAPPFSAATGGIDIRAGSGEGLPYPSLERIGTGSPRRIAQLRRHYPSAHFEPIRGNVDTRLRKLDSGHADALVLACAGLRRLGLADRISVQLPVDECVPAPGQGIIAVERRADDRRVHDCVVALNHAATRTALAAEQAVVAALGGGCQLPLGAFAEVDGDQVTVSAVATAIDGSRMVQAHATGRCAEAVETGMRLARDLSSRGAMELLHA